MPNRLVVSATLCTFAACATGSSDDESSERRKRRDAGTSEVVDAASSDLGGNIVSCYSEGAPEATCTLPTHCCFTNYSAQHNGDCSNEACAYGTIECDGPEDCNGGECCSTALHDATGVTIGYSLACQTTACGAPPAREELCHSSSTCDADGSCVSTFGVNNDLPRSLFICR